MYQLGTVAEFNSLTLPIPDEVKHEVSAIATMLDYNFGASRDVQNDEGGFIFIALNDEDLACYSFGTVKKAHSVKGKVLRTVYEMALGIVNILDKYYGKDKDG